MTLDTDTTHGDGAQAPDDASGSHVRDGNTADDEEGERVLFTTGPSARPAGVKLVAAVVVGLLVEAYLFTHPTLLGSPEATRIGIYIVSLVALIVIARLVVRVYLLTRYRYTITDEVLRWEYSLFYRSRSRELPLSKLRGHESSRGRVQSALGFGTVRFLTGGTNRSLGFLAFEHVTDPEHVRDVVRRQIRED
jgi:uncharacterized membrane protein YdbT with pleckstrin-like domain